MCYTLCGSYRYPDRPRKEKLPSEKRPNIMVLFSGYRYSKLTLSINIDQLAHSTLIAVYSASLEEQEPENETNNFSRSSLEGSTVN